MVLSTVYDVVVVAVPVPDPIPDAVNVTPTVSLDAPMSTKSVVPTYVIV